MWDSIYALLNVYIREELIYILLILFLPCVLILAWMSTYVRNELHITYHVFHLVQSHTHHTSTPPATASAATTESNEQASSETVTDALDNPVTTSIPHPSANNDMEISRRYTLAIAEDNSLESVRDNSLSSDEEGDLTTDEDGRVTPLLRNNVITIEPEVIRTAPFDEVHHSETHYHISNRREEEEAISTPDLPRPTGTIMLRLKYLNDEQKVVFALPTDTISAFKRTHFQSELSANKIVRLIFCGRELKETANARLMEYGVCEDATIHCLITQGSTPTDSTTSMRDGVNENAGELSNETGMNRDALSAATSQSNGVLSDVDLGLFMFPSFGFILSAIWYSRVVYRQYFNVLSTFALVGVSVLYVITLFTFWTTRISSTVSSSSSGPPSRRTHSQRPRSPRRHLSSAINSPFTVREVFHYHIHSRGSRHLRVHNAAISIPPLSSTLESSTTES